MREIYSKAIDKLLQGKITKEEFLSLICEHLDMKNDEIKRLNKGFELYQHLSDAIDSALKKHSEFKSILNSKPHVK